MRVKLGIFIRQDGKHVYGDGRQALLEHIDRLGSIRKAAFEMDMPYRAAWGKIQITEDRLGIKLLERRIGGTDGGGAVLTENARRLMAAYADFRGSLDEDVNERFSASLETHGMKR